MKQRLPLLVLYETKESWYVEDEKPIAIFLEPDEIAVYAYNFEKMQHGLAKQLCEDMTIGNYFWRLPNTRQLQALLDNREKLEETAKLINAHGLHNSRYWGRQKIGEDTFLGVHFGLEREIELDNYQFAYVRPFMLL